MRYVLLRSRAATKTENMFVFFYEKNKHCVIRMSFHGHLGHAEVDLINKLLCLYIYKGIFFKFKEGSN